MRRGAAVIFVVALVSILLLGCPPPASWSMSQSAYQRNDMVSASQYAAQTLKEKPNYAPAVQFLVDMVPKTYDDLTAKAKQDESQANWDDAYKCYAQVKAISDAVGALPGQVDARTKATVTIPTRNVDSLVGNAAQNAAEKHYKAGQACEAAGQQKNAAKDYSAALSFVAGYKDAPARYEACRTAAVKRVAVLGFDNLSGKTEFGSIGEVMSDQIVASAMANPKNTEFLDFVSRDRLGQLMAEQNLGASGLVDQSTVAQTGKLLGLNACVFGKVTSVITNFPQDVATSEKKGGEYKNLVSGATEYHYATVTTYTRKGSVKIVTTFQIIDVKTGSIVKSGSSTQSADKTIQWATYGGDQEALTYTDKSLIQSGEQQLPPPEELANQAVQTVSQDIAEQVSAYFR